MHLRQARPKGQKRDLLALSNHAAFADLQGDAHIGQFNTFAFATWIAKRDGTRVIAMGRRDHMFQLRLIGGGHHDHIWQVGHIGNVKAARMGGPVAADQTCAVYGKAHGQPLKRHIMHNLIITPLQKRGIHRAKRFHATGSQCRTECDAMLLSNCHVKTAAWVALGKEIEPRAIWHRSSHSHNLVILRRKLGQGLTKDRGIAWGVRRRLVLFSGQNIEFRGRMPLVARRFGRRIALAFLRHHMDQDRPGRALMHRAQHWQKLVHIMAINRPQIRKTQSLK